MNITKEMLTDMGLLSQFSYKEYGIYPILKNNTIHEFTDGGITYTLNSSYTVLDYIDTPITDMQALLLQKTGADEYVIAFRGTQETMDMVVDAIIGINNFNPQFSEARDFVQDMMVSHNISAEHLTLTGHSLGGSRKPEDRSRNTEGFPGRRLECFCPAEN